MENNSITLSAISFVSGICSGITKLAVGQYSIMGNISPFDTLKVRCQIGAEPPLRCLMNTIKNVLSILFQEGLLALYKGATPPLIGWVLMDATQYTSLNFFRTLLSKDGKNFDTLTSLDHAFAGQGAGIVVSFVATPIELIKAKLQLQYTQKAFSGPIDCARKIIRKNGILGIYQGLTGCILFRSWFFVLWGSYDVKDLLLIKGLFKRIRETN